MEARKACEAAQAVAQTAAQDVCELEDQLQGFIATIRRLEGVMEEEAALRPVPIWILSLTLRRRSRGSRPPPIGERCVTLVRCRFCGCCPSTSLG